MAPYPQFTRAVDLAFAMARFPPGLNIGSAGPNVKTLVFFSLVSIKAMPWLF
jgi:hypothetical protein